MVIPLFLFGSILSGSVDSFAFVFFHSALLLLSLLYFSFGSIAFFAFGGLRVLLGAKKAMGEKGGIILHNVGEEVKKTFDITGFLDIMDVR